MRTSRPSTRARALSDAEIAKLDRPGIWQYAWKVRGVEGNNGVVGEMTVAAHRPGDVVLAIDPHSGDEDYDPEE